MRLSDRVFLQIRVPKEIEPGPGPILAEQIFAAIHAIREELPWYKRIMGKRGAPVSCEIIHRKRTIRFLVTCPSEYRSLIESQIYAHYPNVEIFEEKDYIQKNEKNEQPFIVGTELVQSNPMVYPIKRYPQFEDKLTHVSADPIAGITSAMAKLNHASDEAWIQMVMIPLDDKWRIKYTEILKIVNKGIFGGIEKIVNLYIKMAGTRKVWPRILFFPLYFYFWIRRKTSGFKNNPLQAADAKSGNNSELKEVYTRTHEKESTIEACMDKISKLLYETNIRIAYLPGDGNIKKATSKVKEIAGTFKQFNIPLLNELEIQKLGQGNEIWNQFKERKLKKDNMILNVEEIATLYHFPSYVVQTPGIDWVKSKKLEAPNNLPSAETTPTENLTMIGKTNYRGMHEVFGIQCDPDRRRHIYIIGKTGMGKTTLLENMIYSDIQAGRGVGVVDPHGDLADRVIDFIPSHRINDVLVFDPSDREFPVSFNMLESIDPAFNSIVCSGLVGIFKKIYAESWGPRLEHILRNVILSLLSYPDTTMLGITRILQDESFRRRVVKKIEDPVVRGFWEGEFDKMSDKFRSEAISPILNKVGQFLSSPIIRNIVGQPKSTINLRFAMDKGKIIIVNLSKGKIGEDNSSLLGAMMITKFQLDAMSRSDIPEKDRKDFFLYVDEFQNFATESFATILSEARKYKLNLTMANQYIAQMPEEVRDAVFGNVGTTVGFQVGYDDAEYLSQQFGEVVTPNDLVNLNKYTIYMRLLIDGMPSRPFSADTLPPPEGANIIDQARREKIIKLSRERYAKSREIVEDKIKRWSKGKEAN